MTFLCCVGLLVAIASVVSAQAPETTASSPTTATPLSSNQQVKVHCTRDYMEAVIVRAEINNLDTSFLHLNDKACQSTSITDEYVKFRTALDGCGTTHNTSSDGKTIDYYNSIIGNLKSRTNDSTITREHQAVMPFKCSFERKVVLSIVSFSPSKALVYTKTAGFGNFTFYMDMYKTEEYKEKHEYPVDIGVGQRIYLEVRVKSNDSKLAVTPLNCRATATAGYEDTPKYVFINDSCSEDKTLKIKHTETAAQRFSMLAFRFLPDYSNVYLHCEVAACRQGDKNSRCASGCQKNKGSGGGRRRRAVEINEIKHTLSLGPIKRIRHSNQQAAPVASTPSGVGMVTIVAIAAGVLALVAMVLVVVVVMVIKRRPPVNGKHALLIVED